MKKQIRKPILYFIITYLIAGSATITVSALVYRIALKQARTKIQISEKAYITGQMALLTHVVDEIATDLLFLSEQNELERFWMSSSPEDKREITEEFSALCLRSGRYDQIRLIEASGREIVRVNFENDRAIIVPEDDLQDKSDRYYFKEAIKHGERQIYISPMDLNVEHQQIEIPFKPVVRFCLPVFDGQGTKRGVLILNFLGCYLIRTLEKIASLSIGDLMLVNSEGFWLHSPTAEDTWGFMIKERTGRTFQNRYPDVWTRIGREGISQIPYRGGIFTCGTVFPERQPVAGKNHPPDENPIAWKIISHVPGGTVAAAMDDFRIQLIRFQIAILILLAIPVFMYTRLVYKRRGLQEELVHSANYDALTGLPNRAMFYGVLRQAVYHAKRYSENFALLFIDIDGFKMVNDTLGHDTGDRLLVAIAARFRDTLRESDFVARLGGDEFMVLIEKINDPKDAKLVAAKLIAAVSEPFTLPSDSDLPDTVKVGASIGISTYPDNGTTSDLLVKKADHEMYRCKRQGKNTYSLCTSGAVDGLS